MALSIFIYHEHEMNTVKNIKHLLIGLASEFSIPLHYLPTQNTSLIFQLNQCQLGLSLYPNIIFFNFLVDSI